MASHLQGFGTRGVQRLNSFQSLPLLAYSDDRSRILGQCELCCGLHKLACHMRIDFCPAELEIDLIEVALNNKKSP